MRQLQYSPIFKNFTSFIKHCSVIRIYMQRLFVCRTELTEHNQMLKARTNILYKVWDNFLKMGCVHSSWIFFFLYLHNEIPGGFYSLYLECLCNHLQWKAKNLIVRINIINAAKQEYLKKCVAVTWSPHFWG